jgi:hypothetical protein
MKLKRNKIFLLVGSIGVIGSTCFLITSCGKSTNHFQNYDYNTSISLGSRSEAKKLYDVASTKLPNFSNIETDTKEAMQQYIREEFQHTNDISKSILY